MNLSLSGKNALVTGGGAGIGQACAVAFARAGANVAICDVNQAGLDQTVALLQAEGVSAAGFLCDVSQTDQVATFFEQAETAIGEIDITLNNAGVAAPLTLLGDTTEADYERVMGINLKGTWLCMREALKRMAPKQSGVIINMASAMSKKSYPGSGFYTTSKFAVAGMTRNTAVEYADKGIRINAICPGNILTPLLESSVSEEIRAQLGEAHPMKRLGEVEEVAHCAVFLASDAASFMTGALLAVDGGWTAL
jgi:NAD(P)-dependent dehydrogenase (short-subunit alcohol dehydrogenase family)